MRSLGNWTMRGSRRLPLLAAGVLLALSTPLDARVSVESDPEADLSRYTMYDYGEGNAARRPDVQDLIVAAIDRELKAKGLRRVDGGAPLRVHTHALFDEHTLQKLADPTYFKFWAGVNVTDPDTLKTGSLVVDLQDLTTGKIVWRGLATGAVDTSFKKLGRTIDKSVARMFRDFPPSRR